MANGQTGSRKRSDALPSRDSRKHADVSIDAADEEEPDGPSNEELPPVDSIVTICENSKHEVGIVCLRMSDFTVDMSSYCDDQTYSKTLSMLTRHEPRQIIFPPAGKDSLLEKIVKNEFELARIEHVGRKYWCDLRGLQYLRHYAPRSEVAALETDVTSKYLCLAALAALIDFAASMEQTTFVKGTLRLKYASVIGAMLLDPSTVRNLEILVNARTGDPKASLWGILSPNVKTSAGSRLLRSSLIQPSNDLATIETRQDCMSELLHREEALADIQRILPGLAEVGRVLKAFMQKSSLSGIAKAQAAIASVLHLKQVLRIAPTLAMALSSNGEAPPENKLLVAICRNLQDEELLKMESAIDTVIEADAIYDKRASQRLLQCLFSVKHNVNNLLDVSRQTLGELTRDMEALTEYYKQELQLNLSLNYNQRRGYHFVLPAAEREIAERSDFIQLQTHGKQRVSCSTEELAQLNMRCQDMISQILMTTEQVLGELIEYVQWHLPVLFRLSESVALLDMIAGFASFVNLSGLHYTCPVVAEGAPLVLKQSRHPILERLCECNAPVPNDVYITSACNMQLVTGPNMAGKSTYLRQTALVCLLAHTGCQVPAEQASVPLLGRIFTRISTADSLEDNASTFVSEMRETSYILRSMGAPALVLADELGRGTSNRDGASLAWAIAERLLKHPNTFTLFATHYLQLANLHELYPNVKLLRLAVDPTASRLRFLYRVQDGICLKASYLTDFLAELSGIPVSVCQLAAKLSAEYDFDPVHEPSPQAESIRTYRAVADRLVWLHGSSTLCDQELFHFLTDLKSKLRIDLKQPQPQQMPPQAEQQTQQPLMQPSPQADDTGDSATMHAGGVADGTDALAGCADMGAIDISPSASINPFVGISPSTGPRPKGRRSICLEGEPISSTFEGGVCRDEEGSGDSQLVEDGGARESGGQEMESTAGQQMESAAQDVGGTQAESGGGVQEGSAAVCGDIGQGSARDNGAGVGGTQEEIGEEGSAEERGAVGGVGGTQDENGSGEQEGSVALCGDIGQGSTPEGGAGEVDAQDESREEGASEESLAEQIGAARVEEPAPMELETSVTIGSTSEDNSKHAERIQGVDSEEGGRERRVAEGAVIEEEATEEEEGISMEKPRMAESVLDRGVSEANLASAPTEGPRGVREAAPLSPKATDDLAGDQANEHTARITQESRESEPQQAARMAERAPHPDQTHAVQNDPSSLLPETTATAGIKRQRDSGNEDEASAYSDGDAAGREHCSLI